MTNEWIGLVPAAGKGLRLSLPYPKELYPIIRNNRYKPVSQFVVDQMLETGVRHIVFVVNETKHQLMAFFGSGVRFNCSFSYVVQEPHNLNAASSTSPGLAHALDAAYHLTRGKRVFFGMPDTIIQPHGVFRAALEQFTNDTDLFLCLFPTNAPQKFGMVRFATDQRVTEIIDKPQHTDLEYMWGCMIWGPRFTELLHRTIGDAQILDFAQVMNRAIQDGFVVRAKQIDGGNFIDLGTYDEIMALDQQLREDPGDEQAT